MDRIDVLDSLHRLMRLTRRYQGGGRGRSSHSEAKLMHILQAHNGISAKELAEKMDIRPPSLSETLDRLEKRGDIVRTRDEIDSRIFRINLTEQGKDVMKQRSKEYSRAQIEIEACLTEDEKKIFCELCGKLSEHLTALSPNRKKGR